MCSGGSVLSVLSGVTLEGVCYQCYQV
uniref:Uncharacterized protein n=1 Tax=Anguilla anguilla TaxID=7936 RepID=A0A0E9VCY6_ANGAN